MFLFCPKFDQTLLKLDVRDCGGRYLVKETISVLSLSVESLDHQISTQLYLF